MLGCNISTLFLASGVSVICQSPLGELLKTPELSDTEGLMTLALMRIAAETLSITSW